MVRAIKSVVRPLGWLVKDSGAQVVFSHIPLAAGIKVKRNKKINQINTCLQAWCHQQDFEIFHDESVYITPGLLETDGVHLS